MEVSLQRVLVDVETDPLTLSVGELRVLELSECRFYMLLEALPAAKAEVDIRGAVSVPLLGASGRLDVSLEGGEFHLHGELSVLWGVWTPTVEASWGSVGMAGQQRFRMALSDIGMALVRLRQIEFVVEAGPQRQAARLRVTISVLAIADLAAEVTFAREQGTTQLGFAVTADLRWASVTVQGSGTIPAAELGGPGATEWELEVSAAFDGEQLLADVSAALDAVAEVAREVWEAVSEAAKQLWDDVSRAVAGLIDDIGAFFDQIKESRFVRMLAAGAKLVAGQVVDFFTDMGESVKNLFVREALQERVVQRQPRRNEYGCDMMREEWTVRRCGRLFGLICNNVRESTEYADRRCMRRHAIGLVLGHADAEAAKVKETAERASRDANPGYERVLRREVALPKPQLEALRHTVPRGSHDAVKRGAAVQAKVRALGGRGEPPLQDRATPAGGAAADIDFSSQQAFEATAGAARTQLVGAVRDTMMSRQEGLSQEVRAEAGHARYTRPRVQAPRQGATVQCGLRSFADLRPQLAHVDSRCAAGASVLLTDEDDVEAPPGTHECGAEFLRLEWTAADGCKQRSDPVVQVVKVLPSVRFTSVPDAALRTTSQQFSGAHLGSPVWDFECEMSSHVDYTDSTPAMQHTCGEWRIDRVWTVAIELSGSRAALRGTACAPLPDFSHLQVVTVRAARTPSTSECNARDQCRRKHTRPEEYTRCLRAAGLPSDAEWLYREVRHHCRGAVIGSAGQSHNEYKACLRERNTPLDAAWWDTEVRRHCRWSVSMIGGAGASHNEYRKCLSVRGLSVDRSYFEPLALAHCRKAVIGSPGQSHNEYKKCLKDRGLVLDQAWWDTEVRRHCRWSVSMVGGAGASHNEYRKCLSERGLSVDRSYFEPLALAHCRKAVIGSPGQSHNEYKKCLKDRGLVLDQSWWRGEVRRHCRWSVSMIGGAGASHNEYRKCLSARGVSLDRSYFNPLARAHCRKAVIGSPGQSHNEYKKCLKDRGLVLDQSWWRGEVRRHCRWSVSMIGGAGASHNEYRKCLSARGVSLDRRYFDPLARAHCRRAVIGSPGESHNEYKRCLRDRGVSLDRSWWHREVRRHCRGAVIGSAGESHNEYKACLRHRGVPLDKTWWCKHEDPRHCNGVWCFPFGGNGCKPKCRRDRGC